MICKADLATLCRPKTTSFRSLPAAGSIEPSDGTTAPHPGRSGSRPRAQMHRSPQPDAQCRPNEGAGEDNSSRHSYSELVPLLREANVQVYCIGITDPLSLYSLVGEPFDTIGRWILSDIAKLTAGKAFFPRNPSELENIVTHIALELRRQYSIGYTPTNQERNGKWRKVKVRLQPPSGLPKLSVRSREGYYALP